jgi:hypothetical protein
MDDALPVGVELYLAPSENAVVLSVTLAKIPQEGEPLTLAIPADHALTLALGILACVRELRRNTPEMEALFPKLDPGKAN